MNSVSLTGRLTKDPEVRTGNSPLCRFTLACDRRWQKDAADFIPCKAWKQSAEYLGQYGHKGDLVEVIGSIETGSYEKDGKKTYTMEVRVDFLRLIGSRKEEEKKSVMDDWTEEDARKFGGQTPEIRGDRTLNIKDDDLPFY